MCILLGEWVSKARAIGRAGDGRRIGEIKNRIKKVMGQVLSWVIQGYLPPGNLVNKHFTGRALRAVGHGSLLA